jgi:hypothetical protein
VSLTAHLTSSTAEHGRLRFHADCPRCRADRLAGTLVDDELVSRRARAALAAGVLAFSSAAPAAVAQVPEVDQEQEGIAAPGGEDPGLEPGFDPGGDDTFDAETAPLQGGGEEDEGVGPPVETEPLTDPEVPVVIDEGPPEPAPEQTPAPAPSPPPATAPPAAPPAAAAPAPVQALVDPGPAEAARAKPRHLRFTLDPERTPDPTERSVGTPTEPVAQAPVAQTAPPPIASTTPEAPPDAQLVPAPQGPVKGDCYAVRPGDSLWSIARRLLGPDVSNGQIAREVNRLWQLNDERIGTGDPSLLHIGTELRLR